MSVDLSTFENGWYKPGAGLSTRIAWYLVNAAFFLNPLNTSSSVKVALLRAFGARVGGGVVIKPRVNVKYPWHLEIGDNTWVGERVWIDNLSMVRIGSNCCLSQGCLLISGSHDYKSRSFALHIGPIEIHDGAWIGAKASVAGGVRVGTHAVLTLQSVATSDLEDYTIYQGNPAVAKRLRVIEP